jgi:1-acyl-sn-glycerol-3-phosphate acyltransferase
MRRILLFFAISLYTLVFGLIAIVLMIPIPNGNPLIWCARPWAALILLTAGVRVRATGRERLDSAHPVIFISNHQSHFDVLALIRSLPGQYRIIAKKELFSIPVFGWALALSGFIKLDRADRTQARASLDLAAARVRAGRSVVVFPEGTRSPDGRLLPFKKGGFILAIESGAPVVPISISGSRGVLGKETLDIKRGAIDVAFGAPIPTRELAYDDRNALIEKTRAAIEAGYTPLHARDLVPAKGLGPERLPVAEPE